MGSALYAGAMAPLPEDAPPAPLRVVSYGGGVQSTALLVLAAQGVVDFRTFLFANVGDDSEHPATLEYVRRVAMPFAEAHGLDLRELQRFSARGPLCDGSAVCAWDDDIDGGVIVCPTCGARFAGERDTPFPDHRPVRTLMGQLLRNGSRSIPIPMRVANGAPGTRQCTYDFKLRVVDRWLREHGASDDAPATVAIGFSTDEIERVTTNQGKTKRVAQSKVFPLLDLGLNRDRCMSTIAAAGLPVPPKSSCYFCPFHRPATWQNMARDEPVLFGKSVALERTLNERRAMLGKDRMFLTRFGRPLDEVMDDSQQAFDLGTSDGPEACDEGYCFT